MSITVISKTKIKPEYLDDAKAHWASQAKAMRANEPGLIKWDILKSANETNTFYCVEEFADQSAIDFHVQQDYVVSSVNEFSKFIEGEMPTTVEGLKTWADITESVVSA